MGSGLGDLTPTGETSLSWYVLLFGKGILKIPPKSHVFFDSKLSEDSLLATGWY